MRTKPRPAFPKFNATRDERAIIRKISERAGKQFAVDYLTVVMDIEATHCNGNPLRLQELLDADASNFFHDVVGINRHLDRSTGHLTGHFCPRFSAPAAS